MAAHAKRGCSASKLDGFFGRAGARHQCGAGQQACGVQFQYGAIDAGGEAEVVGVHNETGHGLSLAAAPGRQQLERNQLAQREPNICSLSSSYFLNG